MGEIYEVSESIQKLIQKAPSLSSLSIQYSPKQFDEFDRIEPWLGESCLEDLKEELSFILEDGPIDIEEVQLIPDWGLWPPDDPDDQHSHSPRTPETRSSEDAEAFIQHARSGHSSDSDAEDDDKDDDGDNQDDSQEEHEE